MIPTSTRTNVGSAGWMPPGGTITGDLCARERNRRRAQTETLPGLIGPGTERADRADRARWLPCRAGAAPVSRQEVGRQGPLPPGQDVDQLVVDLVGILGAREPQTLGDAEDVGVHGDRLLVEGVTEDDVGRLEADTRQRRQLVPRPRHRAAVALDQRPRHADERARLGAVEARRVA